MKMWKKAKNRTKIHFYISFDMKRKTKYAILAKGKF